MTHLVLITTSYPLTRDGSEAAGSFVADLALALSREARITVVAPARLAYDERVTDSLHVRYYPAPRLPLSSLNPQHPADWLAIWLTLIRGSRLVSRIVSRDQVDHLLALWVLPSGWWARQVARRHAVPYSTWALGSDIWTLAKIPIVRGLLKRVLRDAQHNFADGLRLARDVEKLSNRQCEFLPSVRDLPVPNDKVLASSPPYRLAFLGRWHPNKGIDILMDALELLEPSDWAKVLEIRIAGGGPLELQVRAAHGRLKAAGRPVTLLGYLPQQEAADLLAWADYLVIPSRIESIPVVFSDAMRSGTPVIAMPVGDLPQLIEEFHCGLLLENVDAIALVCGLSRALLCNPLEFQLGTERARDRFSISYSKELLIKILAP